MNCTMSLGCPLHPANFPRSLHLATIPLSTSNAQKQKHPNLLSHSTSLISIHTSRSLTTRSSPPQSSSSTPSPTDTSSKLEINLPTTEAQQTLQLMALPTRQGTNIIIKSVTPGSQASKEGILPGSRLLAISDPIRDNGPLWTLNDRASIRFVMDALRLRTSSTITIVVTRDKVVELENILLPQGDASSSSTSNSSSDNADDGSAAAAAASTSQSTNSNNVSSIERPLTIGERMELEWREKEGQIQQQKSAYEKRVARRQGYFEEASGRDDSKFFVYVGAAFLLPAAVILIVAFYSGYLDKLATGYGY